MTTRQLEKLDPNLALRDGQTDPTLLLILWVVRKCFFPLIWLGLSIAVIGLGDLEQIGDQIPTLDDPAAAFGALLSPLGGLVLALGVRLAANLSALAAAFPLTSWTRSHDYTFGWRFNRWFRSWWDRIYLARAYRSLRWTAVVRELAYQRLGDRGRAIRITEITVFWMGIVFFVAFLISAGSAVEA